MTSFVVHAGGLAGNSSTAHRLAAHVEATTGTAAVVASLDQFALSVPTSVALVVALNLHRTGVQVAAMLDAGTPLVMVATGSDYNTFARDPQKLAAMQSAVSASRARVVAFTREALGALGLDGAVRP